jgi:hypothetical protein
MFVRGDGNVGIGTTAPGQKLQVDGSLLVNTGTSVADYRDIMMGGIGGWSTGESHGIDTVYGGASNPTTFSRIESYFDGTNGKIRFRNLYNASAARTDILMTIQGNGNVGIGTDGPSNKLTVYQGGGVRVTGITSGDWIEMSGDLPGYSANQYPVIKSNGTIHFANNNKYSAYLEGANTYFGILDNTTTTRVFLATSGNTYFTGGNVGIGTTNPSQKLEVYGARVAITDTSNDTAGYYARVLSGGTQVGNFTLRANNDGSTYLYNGTTSDSIKQVWLTNGNVGIGTTAPSEKLHVVGSYAIQIIESTVGGQNSTLKFTTTARTWGIGANMALSNSNFEIYDYSASANRLTIDTSGNVGIGTTAPGYKLDVSGTIRATGDVIAYSDARVKENIETLDGALDKVMKMRGVSYNKIGEQEKKVGVIAQEILEVLPEVVSQDETGTYSVAYGNIVSVLIEAIKEQQKQIDELKSKLK